MATNTKVPQSKKGNQLLRNLKPTTRRVVWISSSFIALFALGLIIVFQLSDTKKTSAADSGNNKLEKPGNPTNADQQSTVSPVIPSTEEQTNQPKQIETHSTPTPAVKKPATDLTTGNDSGDQPETSLESAHQPDKDLNGFKAEFNNNQVFFSWSAQLKAQPVVFIIERSLDGKHFEQIYNQKETGNGLSPVDFNAIDASPLYEPAYYRLKQIQQDGYVFYSALKKIDSKTPATDVTELKIVSYGPNPFNDKLNLSFSQELDFDVDLEIINSSGMAVFIDIINGKQGMNQYEFIDKNGLPAGTYYLALLYNHKKQVRKIIKN